MAFVPLLLLRFCGLVLVYLVVVSTVDSRGVTAPRS